LDRDTLRILDVNHNRAREALRVIEDYARLVLDDRDAAAALKACRHELRALATAFSTDCMLSARDIVGDVGRDVKTGGELARQAPLDVVRAAFGRLTEATRSLGEYAKLENAEAAQRAEQMRYRAYELEQRIVLRGDLRQRFAGVRLYVLITASLCKGDWRAVAEAALRGGAGCLQLREKELPDGELMRRALALRELTARHDALLFVNDRPDIARLVHADGVHVGQDDLPVDAVRRIAGTGLLIGKSTHTAAQFAAALAEQPDYLAVGPMFESATKPQDHIAGPETLRQARGQTGLPLVAIGGITTDNAASVWEAGADCLAVCSTIIGARNVQAATEGLAEQAVGHFRGRAAESSDG
jgi:thiamine-phosphate pyrophosphorylase